MTSLIQRVTKRYIAASGLQITASGVSIFSSEEMSYIVAVPKKLGGFIAAYNEAFTQLAPLQELLQSRILKKAIAHDLACIDKFKAGLAESDDLVKGLKAIEAYYRQKYKDGVKFLKDNPEESFEWDPYPDLEALSGRVRKFQETMTKVYQDLELYSTLDDLKESTESSTFQTLCKKLGKLEDLEEWLYFLDGVADSIDGADEYVNDSIESEIE